MKFVMPDGADVDHGAGDDLVDPVADAEPGEEEAEQPADQHGAP